MSKPFTPKVVTANALLEGDVIYLQSESKKPVDVYVGDLNLYKAYPVRKENSTAVQISEILRIK